MRPKFTLTVRLTDDRGQSHGFMAQNLGEDVVMFGDRLADDMRAGLAFVGPGAFDQTVRILKERKFRRDLLIDAATQLGHSLADYLEDAEGWHGEDRQERIKRHRHPAP